MGLGTKIAAGSVVLGLIAAAGAALWFLAFNEEQLTQVLGPKEVPTPKDANQGQQTGAQGRAAPGGTAQPVWRVSCSGSQARLDCRAAQTLFVKKTGRPFLTVVVRAPSDTKKSVMLVRAPLGTYLPAGVSLQFAQGATQTLPFKGCNRSGCVAAYQATEAEIADLLNGEDLRVTIQNQRKQPITLRVPAADFPEAYARMRERAG